MKASCVKGAALEILVFASAIKQGRSAVSPSKGELLKLESLSNFYTLIIFEMSSSRNTRGTL